jgi:putative ABC transport system substrate-binding protein
MKRREFITFLGGAAAWPLAARAQQGERMRRIGVLLPVTADDPEFQARVGVFLQALALLGWTIDGNMRIDTRWAGPDVAEIRRHAAELAALAPDVILAQSGSAVRSLLQATRTVPIVFPNVVDPVGAGLVDSLARPGGSATGFMSFEYSLSGKWLELLKQILASGSPQHRDLIITLAARHRLPAVYPGREAVVAGGLLSYGADQIDQYRKAAGYVDRILKGENPADLPVQAPTKYETVLNLKTAKALGLDVPATVYARADAVIE